MCRSQGLGGLGTGQDWASGDQEGGHGVDAQAAGLSFLGQHLGDALLTGQQGCDAVGVESGVDVL